VAVGACTGCVKVGTAMQFMYVIIRMEECGTTFGTCTIEFMAGCIFSVFRRLEFTVVHYLFLIDKNFKLCCASLFPSS
jgi:hypothetical protein